METRVLTRRRRVFDQEIQEPTLFAFFLTAAGIVLLVSVCLLGIFFLPAYGRIWWVFAVVAVILVLLVVSFRRKKKAPNAPPRSDRQRWFRRIVTGARILFIGILTCWLGLIVSAIGPGGAAPRPKTDPGLIRVITWN